MDKGSAKVGPAKQKANATSPALIPIHAFLMTTRSSLFWGILLEQPEYFLRLGEEAGSTDRRIHKKGATWPPAKATPARWGARGRTTSPRKSGKPPDSRGTALPKQGRSGKASIYM
jgi:hypothetical protein